MARPNIKGRGLNESKVLAVRINKNIYEEFVEVCRKNNLDKATIVEEALINWMIQNVDRKTFRLKPKEEVRPSPPLPPHTQTIQEHIEDEVKQGVNKCPDCGSTQTEMREEGLYCINCDRIVIPSWELKLREYTK